jgi:hypothetical protein
VREVVAAKVKAPVLLVRRHGQKRLRRPKEWIVDTGETRALERVAEAESRLAD